ncbi:hypothetical protein NEFER03_1518 [Nematocida sp. LUAm3]|nr:hypothetical protein NEFER03_1518 [Nematocida sp. LUAm3]KAI5174551.1 hypothetical protein NEFER02_0672 [Nematocida sp. LUAm2]KAI5178043.1 hypothetical protein NEFER01_1225 [Nematocida sp. LUAm1]
MRIFLRRERRRNYIILCTWKMFVVFITLLSIGLSTESGLKKHIRNKWEIHRLCNKIERLLYSFTIAHHTHPHYMTSEELSTKIKYIEDIDKFSIDLKEFNMKKILVMSREELNQNDNDLETILNIIEAITVNIMYINTEEMSDTVFSMLIERVVVITKLYIRGKNWWRKNQNIAQPNGKMEKAETDVSLTKEQEISIKTPKIVIENLSEYIIGDILECIKLHTITILIIKTNRIKNLNLNQFNTKNVDTIICIECGLDLKSIKFPGNDITKSLSVKLYDLPKLISIENSVKDSSIPIALKDLYIDRESFRTLSELADKENAHKSIKKTFKVKNTFIDYVPYTFRELASSSSVPWIETTNITFLTDCNKHVCGHNIISNQFYYLGMLKNLGMLCSNLNGWVDYENFVDKDVLTKKYMYSFKYMQKFIKTVRSITINHFTCPSNSEFRFKIPFFKIDLGKSDEIQEVIDEFQKKYDMLCPHVYYRDIHVLGYNAPKKWFNVMVNTFRWLGQEIQIDSLSFHDMKEPSNSNVKKERPPSIGLPKLKFILTELYFYNSEISFIKHMLEHYNYTPEATILIDCHKIEEKDFLYLYEKTKQYGFSKIILKNASKIVENMCKNPDQIDPDLKSKLMISKGKPEYHIALFDIIDCLPLQIGAVFSAHFCELIENSFPNVSMKVKNKDSYYVVSRSMKEACDELSKVMKDLEIDFLLRLDIFICNYCSNNDSFTTIEQLSRLVSLINNTFNKLTSLTILNIRMKKEEYKKIRTLNALIGPTNNHGLQGMFLRGYIIDDGKEEKPALSTQQREEPCLHEEVETSGKEKLETLNHWIKRYL